MAVDWCGSQREQCFLRVGSRHRCLLQGILHRLNLTFDESIRLWEVWAGRYVVEAPLGGEVSKSLTAIVSTVVAHNLAWRSILRKHLTHLRYDAVTRHLPLDAVDKREFRVVVTDEKIRDLSYGKQVCADDLPRTCR